MARTVSRGVVKTRARQLADVVNDPNVTETWLNQLFDLHAPAVWDFLADCGPADYLAATTTITTAAGQVSYALPVNFHSLTAVYAVEDGQRRPINPLTDRQRGSFKFPSAAFTLEVEFIPSCPTFSDDNETVDGINGWDELISAKMARDIMIRRGADRSVMLDIIAGCEDRIRSRVGKRDRVGPQYIVDVENYEMVPGIPTSLIAGYRLRGNNIEFYESIVMGWM